MQLTLAEWPELDDLESADERVSKALRRQKPGRSGEHESPRSAIPVDGGLERSEECGGELNFVDDQWTGTVPLDERAWVALGGCSLSCVIERDQRAAGAEDLSGATVGSRCVHPEESVGASRIRRGPMGRPGMGARPMGRGVERWIGVSWVIR